MLRGNALMTGPQRQCPHSSLPAAVAAVSLCCQAAIFCIFDGHNGRNAAEQAKTLLPAQLAIHLPAAAAAAAVAAPEPGLALSSSAAAAGSQQDEGTGGACGSRGCSTLSCDAATAAQDGISSSQQGEHQASSSNGGPLLLGVKGSSSGSSSSSSGGGSSRSPPLLGTDSSSSRRSAWEAAFLATDQALSCDDGCTATALLVEAGQGGAITLQVANVGDSEAVLVDMARYGGGCLGFRDGGGGRGDSGG